MLKSLKSNINNFVFFISKSKHRAFLLLLIFFLQKNPSRTLLTILR